MKVTVFTQDYCAPCIRLKPIVDAACEQLELAVEYINITNQWHIADREGFSSTPAVFVYANDVRYEITARTAVHFFKALEEIKLNV